jgi:HTH-type transcriptional regulator / antitoxin HigA
MADESKSLFDSSPQHPGDHLRELLAERGLTQEELAVITGRSRQQIIDIVTRRRGITPEMAVALGAAFGQRPGYWLTMDAAFRLSTVNEPKDAIMERARLFELAPIKDMQKRGWLPSNAKVDELPSHLMAFFETETLADPIGFPLVTRKTASLADLTPAQRAWCFRARQMAKGLPVQKFDHAKLDKAKAKLRKLAAYRNEAVHTAEVLADFGIRFVVVEPLPTAKIDGAAFWLDDGPAIAVSIRYDRHDYFWFTLMHEFMHIEHQDVLSIDQDLGRDDHTPTLLKDDIERRADESAADALVSAEELESFIRRMGPLYSQKKIIQFAHSVKMHPGIIVGQLQNRGEIGWDSQRELLVKIREIVTETAITDGWGQTIGSDAA